MSDTTTIRIDRNLYPRLIRIAQKMEKEVTPSRRISMNEVIEAMLKERKK